MEQLLSLIRSRNSYDKFIDNYEPRKYDDEELFRVSFAHAHCENGDKICQFLSDRINMTRKTFSMALICYKYDIIYQQFNDGRLQEFPGCLSDVIQVLFTYQQEDDRARNLFDYMILHGDCSQIEEGMIRALFCLLPREDQQYYDRFNDESIEQFKDAIEFCLSIKKPGLNFSLDKIHPVKKTTLLIETVNDGCIPAALILLQNGACPSIQDDHLQSLATVIPKDPWSEVRKYLK